MESWEDLATWRSQVNEEEEFITNLLAEIDKQINCLQVEQMELSSSMREKRVESQKDEKLKTEKPDDKTSEKLDLTIPAVKKNDTEEEEEDDDEDL